MGRVNVWVADELRATVREALPDLNWSAVLADALRARLRVQCDHREALCARCGHGIDLAAVRAEAIAELWDAVRPKLRAADWLITSREAAAIVHDVAGRRAGRVLDPAPSWDETGKALGALSPAQGYVNAERARERQILEHRHRAELEAQLAADEARYTTGRGRNIRRLPLEDDSRRKHPTARKTQGATPAPPITQERSA